MKTKKYSAVLGLTALLGTTCLVIPAMAGGLYGQPVGGMKDSVVIEDGMAIPAPIPMEETATWYIRGDIGFGWHGDASGSHNALNYPNAAVSDIDSALSIGGGIGYYFTQNFRADLTFDHRTDAETGGTQVMDPTNEGPDLKNQTLLANIYYDFKPASKFSPYIGGGIGLAFNELNMSGSAGSYTVQNAYGQDVTVTQRALDDKTTEFAAMATVGVNIALRENLFLDIGYRYNYLGEAKLIYERTETAAALGGAAASVARSTNTLSLDSMSVHELKLGLRYDLY